MIDGNIRTIATREGFGAVLIVVSWVGAEALVNSTPAMVGGIIATITITAAGGIGDRRLAGTNPNDPSPVSRRSRMDFDLSG